jgi:hypothetical protein
MTISIREQILITVSLMDRAAITDLESVVCSHPGCEDLAQVRSVLGDLIHDGLVGISYGITADADEVYYIALDEDDSPMESGLTSSDITAADAFHERDWKKLDKARPLWKRMVWWRDFWISFFHPVEAIRFLFGKRK